ncbi:DUF1189 family protein [Halobacillus salinus]|uniref:DUF1189 domain-containing protein n=1 Tax=Halobacillus salinus TaxID=192814 RepID=A0A4Z0GXK4_9BACI|nr:DUF1189 family protein [Halobacillus salinus]TGB02002.1 DUF1189 domain-containing protein [Halobacillus salinus]
MIDSLLNSFRLPKKEAMFRLNRKGITHTIGYLFLLLAVLFLPDMIGTIIRLESDLTEVSRGLYLAQVFVFYPLLIIFLIIVGVSIFAGAAMVMKNVMGRKLAYQQLWKMSAYASTIPLILSVLLKNLAVSDWISAVLFIGIFTFLIFRMIRIYPKAPTK